MCGGVAGSWCHAEATACCMPGLSAGRGAVARCCCCGPIRCLRADGWLGGTRRALASWAAKHILRAQRATRVGVVGGHGWVVGRGTRILLYAKDYDTTRRTDTTARETRLSRLDRSDERLRGSRLTAFARERVAARSVLDPRWPVRAKRPTTREAGEACSERPMRILTSTCGDFILLDTSYILWAFLTAHHHNTVALHVHRQLGNQDRTHEAARSSDPICMGT